MGICLPSRLNMKAASGFTLVELLVVLTLIGVMTTSVAVALRGREDPHAVRVAAEDLATALRYAQAESEHTDVAHRLVVAADGRSYRVEWADPSLGGDSRGGGSGYVPVRGMAGRSHHLIDGVTLAVDTGLDDQSLFVSRLPTDETEMALYFGDGVDTYAGALLLQNTASEVVRVSVMPETGQVRVEKP